MLSLALPYYVYKRKRELATKIHLDHNLNIPIYKYMLFKKPVILIIVILNYSKSILRMFRVYINSNEPYITVYQK